MSMKTVSSSVRPEPWNKGRLIGQKRPLTPKEVWTIRVRLEIAGTKRNLALFNLAIDSKLGLPRKSEEFLMKDEELHVEAATFYARVRGGSGSPC